VLHSHEFTTHKSDVRGEIHEQVVQVHGYNHLRELWAVVSDAQGNTLSLARVRTYHDKSGGMRLQAGGSYKANRLLADGSVTVQLREAHTVGTDMTAFNATLIVSVTGTELATLRAMRGQAYAATREQQLARRDAKAWARVMATAPTNPDEWDAFVVRERENALQVARTPKAQAYAG
jgi:hypothetical protein